MNDLKELQVVYSRNSIGLCGKHFKAPVKTCCNGYVSVINMLITDKKQTSIKDALFNLDLDLAKVRKMSFL